MFFGVSPVLAGKLFSELLEGQNIARHVGDKFIFN